MLVRFKPFLIEKKKSATFDATSPAPGNDAAGKTLEALTTVYTHPRDKNRKSINPGKIREGAADVVHGLVSGMDPHWHEVIKHHSRLAADALRRHFSENGVGEVASAHWTSHANDPAKLSASHGVPKPIKTTADFAALTHEDDTGLSVKTKGSKTAQWVSMKYTGLQQHATRREKERAGVSRKDLGKVSVPKINDSNPGLKSLAAHAMAGKANSGVKVSDYTGQTAKHINHLRSLGYTGTATGKKAGSIRQEWLADKAGGPRSAGAQRAKLADDAQANLIKSVSNTHKANMAKLTSKELEAHGRKVFTPPGNHNEYMLHAHVHPDEHEEISVQRDGVSKKINVPKVSIRVIDKRKRYEDHISKFVPGSLHVDTESKGSSINVHGTDKITGKKRLAFSHGIKAVTRGPSAGIVGTSSLPAGV